ncbi:MAG: hypothetical protein HXS43_13445 [Theionarchaea archaeon]|nr:hypothetical protein [Theionarchaea archaeon]
MTKDDGQNLWEYSYDYENRPLSVKKDGQVTEEYFYDGDGKRIKKVDDNSERIYISGGLNVLYEVNTTTQMEAVYIYGPTGQLAKKVNDITEYYHTDHLGSTRLVTSENGVTTEEIMYKPFGGQLNETEERYTYNGKELDETGLYFYGARYYDPVIGRFISRDPLTGKRESPQTLNRYAYCLNNPLKYIDPAGESIRSVVENTFGRLEGIDPEDLEEIQKLMDAGKQALALKRILTLLGFTFEDNKDGTFKVQIDEDTWYTMVIDNNLKVRGVSAYGSTDHGEELISINFDLTGVAGDIMLTVLHEMCHGFLGGTSGEEVYREEKRIYEVELSYTNTLASFGLVSDRFVRHIKAQATNYRVFLPRIPFSDMLKRWRRGWNIC